MRLKDYQVKALETLSSYLTALSEVEANAERTAAAVAALPVTCSPELPPFKG
jgi:hypothetical protein